MENPIKIDDLGVPLFFWKHPYLARIFFAPERTVKKRRLPNKVLFCCRSTACYIGSPCFLRALGWLSWAVFFSVVAKNREENKTEVTPQSVDLTTKLPEQ